VTRTAGLDVVRARPLNHIGPGQPADYAVANFARQVVAVERGRQPPWLEVGNLHPRRDLTDVRDVVRAYQLLMAQGRRGEVYNVASGTTHTMAEVLDRLVAQARVQVEVRARPDPGRVGEVQAICADAGKLRRETGWTPAYSLEQTLADTLAYWRARET
jgi:GDP-4-dehydro-6-deoxy-D-mannose reductase